MDSKDDPATTTTSSSSSSSQSKPTSTNVGSIRWAEDSHSHSHSDSFTMDVTAFEKHLKEKREQKLQQQSPRIDIQLKAIPSTSSSATARAAAASSPGNQIKVNIRHDITPGTSDLAGHDEIDHAIPIHSTKTTRVITYEKVFKQKSIREISVMKKHSPTDEHSHVHMPKVQRTSECSIEKCVSNEQIGNIDDSAYHSHRVLLTSTGTPTVSISSSSASLPPEYVSDENIYAYRTPSREKIYMERAGSEPKQFPSHLDRPHSNRLDDVSMNVVYAGDRATSTPEWNLVSSVTDGNEHIRRHLDSEPDKSSSECASPDWYCEYQAQTFHTDRPHRMEYIRSNSQYDKHIKQIRGIITKHFSYFYT